MQQLSVFLIKIQELPEHHRWILALASMVLLASLFIVATAKMTLSSINASALNFAPSQFAAVEPSLAGSPRELTPAEGIGESLKGVGSLFVSQNARDKAKTAESAKVQPKRGIGTTLRTITSKINKTLSDLGVAIADQIHKIGK